MPSRPGTVRRARRATLRLRCAVPEAGRRMPERSGLGWRGRKHGWRSRNLLLGHAGVLRPAFHAPSRRLGLRTPCAGRLHVMVCIGVSSVAWRCCWSSGRTLVLLARRGSGSACSGRYGPTGPASAHGWPSLEPERRSSLFSGLDRAICRPCAPRCPSGWMRHVSLLDHRRSSSVAPAGRPA